MAKKMLFEELTVGEIRAFLETSQPNKRQVKQLLGDERAGVRKLIESYLRAQDRLAKEAARCERMWSYERAAKEQGYRLVAGIDEAGRGPLAGPVVVGAVILPEEIDLPGLNDSKQVKEETREELFERICDQAVAYGIGIVDVDYIDKHNILQATFEGARRAIAEIGARFALEPDYLLTDCLKVPGVTQPYQAIIKGDASSFSIAAASILAKVTRDRLMVRYAEQYPEYGFDKHKGYASAEHMAAIEKHGACPIHRTSFAPFKQSPQMSLFEGMDF
jgi:ribonuclease HII